MNLTKKFKEYKFVSSSEYMNVKFEKVIHLEAIEAYCKGYRGGKYLEVGTNYGNSALQAWMTFAPSKMVLCDMFNEKRMIPFIQRTLLIVNCTSEVTFITGDSHQTVKRIKDTFDVILVDGDHTKKGALQDLRETWPLLRNGGIMLFDDIELVRLEEAIDDFSKSLENLEWIKKHKEWKHGVAVLKKGKK